MYYFAVAKVFRVSFDKICLGAIFLGGCQGVTMKLIRCSECFFKLFYKCYLVAIFLGGCKEVTMQLLRCFEYFRHLLLGF